MPRILWIWFIVVSPALAQGTGAPLAPWSPGILDIHQIQTGRGNAAFFVFPDGTTMLLDAGLVPERKGLEIGPKRPDSSRSTPEWIAHYIRQFSRRTPASLDYAVVTHYHDDHMGALPQVAALIPTGTLIDRGEEPAPPPYPVVRAYFDFRRKHSGVVQPLQVGRA
ncbi:MAG: MBL fold metallo-hydrolase, partial [Acidobacteria bacterium]|nr:MBL fold metallo-hydrolase [Acidobacteriota bacterium]